MGCACEHRKIGQDLERARRLAKAYARMEGRVAVIVQAANGTYSFLPLEESTDKTIIEYITEY